MMNDWGMGWGSGGMWFGPLFVVGLGVLAIFAVAYYFRSSNDRSRPRFTCRRRAKSLMSGLQRVRSGAKSTQLGAMH